MSSGPLPVYKMIESHALAQPEALAVVCEQASLTHSQSTGTHLPYTQLTYSQLNHQANRLAHGLLARKIAQGGTVAILISPSEAILVALIATHKIGAIYVPIDPGYPKARIEAILDEISPSIVIWENQQELIPAEYGSACYTVAELIDPVEIDTNPDILVDPESVSHIYFTSGTTGKPKGVLSTHDNLLHYISTAVRRYRFNQNDKFLAAARFTFSISMFELMTPLYVGGQVRILPRETVLDLHRLSDAVTTATVFHFGPSLLKQLLPYIKAHYSSFAPFDHLRHVSSGGDMVPPHVLEDLKTIFRNAEVFVIYGSSEISCMGCTWEVPRKQTVTRTLVGKAHYDMKVMILDAHGEPADVGVPGQLYFSGRGLVKGYLNLPELTQQKFTLIDGERFYAIGDVGRYDQDGNIELLGREDFQVQIRGMRVELLEIEARLKNHPAIADCVVVGRHLQDNDEKTLISYLVAKNETGISARELRDYVAEILPDYMVPTLYVKLEKLPTNHNAKLDRSQLPLPNADNILVSGDFVPPVNNVEESLTQLWRNLFKLENIGVTHDFFELGGDSLLAVQFLIAVENQFQIFIPISAMLAAPTIRDIAKIIHSETDFAGVGDVVVLKRGNTEPPLFCLYGVLLYKDLAESLITERMVCGVYLEEEVALMHKGKDSEEFQIFSSVYNIADRYLKSIRAFQPHGPYYLCGESFGGITALEVARKLQAEGEIVQCLAMFDTDAPGHLQSLPLTRRIFTHLKLLRENGLTYLREKFAHHRNFTLTPTGEPSGFEHSDIREQARALASKHYLPEPYDGDVILFRATDRSAFDSGSIDLGWAPFIRHLEVYDIPGDHLGILKRGQVEAIADVLNEIMAPKDNPISQDMSKE